LANGYLIQFRDSNKRRIIGVVNDFNFKSLKQDVDALVISPADDRRQILVKLKPGNLQAGIALVKKRLQQSGASLPVRI